MSAAALTESTGKHLVIFDLKVAMLTINYRYSVCVIMTAAGSPWPQKTNTVSFTNVSSNQLAVIQGYYICPFNC